ncbi:PfkB family carbohydrate kinase [Actinoplanes friuliensis]|uniref:Putative PfkB-family carbohydrate kinase n=1 Tax=Actinoplanes friuliensis DSM 7358 TaxID=1246995 RepID=U5W2N6_9ACTN|nr:PfkB family carbohydrate kinase [Actinoplanes friuliensis]AGZ42245.1 putative PfkB-family carbohydrate kinase [Actinoplanes friuliensis DSM 7358]
MHVVCVGLATVDLVQRVDRMPGPDEKAEALSASVAAGGPATNAAVTAAALGATVTLVTAVGSHPLAALIRADLAECGVTLLDATPEATTPPPVSAVTVLAATGQRTIVSRNARGSEVAAPAGLASVLASADVVLVDGHHPALARAAAASGRLLVLDAGSWRPIFAELLPLADVVAASAAFRLPTPGLSTAGLPTPGPTDATHPAADFATPDANPPAAAYAAPDADPPAADLAAPNANPPGADLAAPNANPPAAGSAALGVGPPTADLAQPGPTDVVPPPGDHEGISAREALRVAGVRRGAITRGPDPIIWWSGDENGELAVPAVPAVDTAGAGDVFHGALAVALGRGLTLVPALRFATEIAGIRVRHAGPRSWLAALRG